MADTFREKLELAVFLLRNIFARRPLKRNKKKNKQTKNLKEENNYFG